MSDNQENQNKAFQDNEEIRKWSNTSCGDSFKEAFDCYRYSRSQIKGADCLSKFKEYIDCCSENPSSCPSEVSNLEL